MPRYSPGAVNATYKSMFLAGMAHFPAGPDGTCFPIGAILISAHVSSLDLGFKGSLGAARDKEFSVLRGLIAVFCVASSVAACS